MKRQHRGWTVALCLRPMLLLPLTVLPIGCGRQPEPSLQPAARPEMVAALRADLEAERHSSDGAGDVRLLDSTAAKAGAPGRWVVEFTVGDRGIAAGGAVYFQVSPFWGWSTPQVEDPTRPGYTVVSASPESLRLDITTIDEQLLLITAEERLDPATVLIIDYGAGFPGSGAATADTFRDREARLWIGVDGDGDGVRGWLEHSPAVNVAAGEPAQWQGTLPATARPGGFVKLHIAALDALGSRTVWSGPVDLKLPIGLSGPNTVDIDDGVAEVEIALDAQGLYRIGVAGDSLAAATSNPLLVSETFPRLLWGDLHGHTGLSDGTGTPEDYFDYARRAAGLDFAAVTDHDHWGIQPLDRTPDNWNRIRQAVATAHAPPDFVALLGYEWTNWLYGHRHVVHFADDGPLVSSIDRESEHPRQLWQALTGLPTLTFAHHSAGDPIPTDWSIEPDPVLEPITEVASVHGSSEATDTFRPVRGARPGQFIRDALDRGYQLGFIGSGDSHDGHPGLTHLAAAGGGLAAVFAAENSRAAILEALRARRAYATDGERILLRTTLDGSEMGSRVAGRSDAKLHVFIAGTAPVASIEAIADGRTVAEHQPEPGATAVWDATLDTRDWSYLYLRVRQSGSGVAWSSPFFLDH